MGLLILPDGERPPQPGAILVQSGLSFTDAQALVESRVATQAGVQPSSCPVGTVLWYAWVGADGQCHSAELTEAPADAVKVLACSTSYNDVVAQCSSWQAQQAQPSSQPPTQPPTQPPAPAGQYVGIVWAPPGNNYQPELIGGKYAQCGILPAGQSLPGSAWQVAYGPTSYALVQVWAAQNCYSAPAAPPVKPIPPVTQPPIGEPPVTQPPIGEPPPCPPQQPCPPCPVDTTTPPATLGAPCNLPTIRAPSSPVGSPEWCLGVKALRDDIASVGNALASAATLHLIDGTDTWLSLFQAFFALPLAIPSRHAPAISQTIRDIVSCWRATIAAVAPCDAGSLVGVAVVLAALRVLRKLRIGWDAGIWSTLDIEASVEPIERVCEYLLRSLCPVEIPGEAEAMECKRRGTITREQYECWMLVNGCDPQSWEPALQARRERLTTDETIELGFREDWPIDRFASELQKLGWMDLKEIGARLSLHWEVPTIADHLLWMSRNVGDPNYVEQYGLLEGFDERFWSKYSHDLTVQGMRREVAMDHYAAHWLRPSPGQLQEFVYRLRPDKPGVQHPFTLQDYVNTLTEKEVVKFDRERFAEIIYQVPALTYVREMFRNYTVGEDYLKSIHQDLGFSPSDSDNFVKVDEITRARIRATEGHGWTPAALAHAFVSGAMDEDGVTVEMQRQGWTPTETTAMLQRAQADLAYTAFTRARSRTIFAALTEVKQCLTVGVCDARTAVNQLTALGWDLRFAESWVTIQLSAANTALVRQGVSRIRSAYLSGETDPIRTQQSLNALGIVPDAVQRYIATWELERTPKHKHAERAEIVKHVCSGDMGTAEAIARLRAMGYPDADVRLYLADAQGCISQRQQKAQAEIQKQNAARARELDKLRRQALQQAKELLREMRRAEPVAKLQKWASVGFIDVQHFVNRMSTYGYSEQDIAHYWDEASTKKGSVIQAGQTAGVHPTGSSNGSGGPIV